MPDLTLLVLAAGIGSRYGGLKQVEPVGPSGELLMEYSVYDARRAGFNRLVFVIRKEIEQAFHETLGQRLEGKLPISYVFQELDSLPEGLEPPAGRQKPWGTGHAILVAQEAVQGPFAAINADDFYGQRSYELVAESLRQGNGSNFSMVGFLLRNTLSDHGTVSRGVCKCTAQGLLESIEEHPRVERQGSGGTSYQEGKVPAQLTGEETVSMNMWGFPPSLFGHLSKQFREFLELRGREDRSEFYIPAVVDRLIREGTTAVDVLRSPECWFGVTYPEDKPRVVEGIRRQIDQGAYPSQLWK